MSLVYKMCPTHNTNHRQQISSFQSIFKIHDVIKDAATRVLAHTTSAKSSAIHECEL